jgi:hypothetical protein
MSLKLTESILAIMATIPCLGATTVHRQASGTSTTTESEADLTNAATNPVSPKVTLQTWDNWLPRPSGTGGRGGNSLLSRNIIPVKIFGVTNLFHVEEPVNTNSTVPGGTQTKRAGRFFKMFRPLK